MWNHEYMENIKQLEKDLEIQPRATVYVNHEWGSIIVIKLKTIQLNNETM